MRRILILTLVMLLIVPFVIGQGVVDVALKQPTYRVNEPIYMFYNITLPTNACCAGLGIEHDNGTRYMCAGEGPGQPGGSTFEYQVCTLLINETGTYKVFKAESLVFKYLGVIDIEHALPTPLSIGVLIVSFAFLILAIVFNPIFYLVAIFGLIGSITTLIFTYQYILSPIFIGVISIIYLMLLVLVYEIFKRLF